MRLFPENVLLMPMLCGLMKLTYAGDKILGSHVILMNNYIILDLLEEDTRKYWTRCDNNGRVEDESNIVTSSPNISLYPPKTGNPILLLLFRSPL